MQKLKSSTQKLDLLCLEEFECVTHELTASLRFYDPSNHTPVFETGTLYINSKSLIFMPDVDQKPLYKFLFKYFENSPSLKDGKRKIEFMISRIVEIKRDGPPSPYLNRNVIDEKDKLVAITLDQHVDSVQLEKWIKMLLDLQHNDSHIDDIVLYVSNLMISQFNIYGLDSKITESVSETLIVKEDQLIQRILPMVEYYGFLYLTNKNFYFKRIMISNTNSYVKVPLKDIKKLLKRRLYLQPRAIEIELADKQYYYFGFRNEDERNNFYDLLLSHLPSNVLTEKSLNSLRDSWVKREISNFDYLLSLNQLAARSFNDLSQYPVFPWLLINFDSKEIDIEDESNYRNLKEPIGALNKRRLEFFRKRFYQLPEGERFMYGTHYSTPGYVCYYLVRQKPRYMLRLQNGKFDIPDRLFYSVKKDWKNCYEHDGCIKELIPEFYGDNTDFLENKLGLNLGKRQNMKTVCDVKLPKWAKDAADFLYINRQGRLISFRE